MFILRACIGLAFFIGVAWLLSSDRKRFPWQVVVFGLALQFALAVLVLYVPQGFAVIQAISDGVREILNRIVPGAEILFGPAGEPITPDTNGVLAFSGAGLIAIIVFSALLAVLYYLRVMQLIVWALAWVMSRLLRVSGAESLAMAANVFVGQTEAPLVVRPYLDKMTRSELMALMTGGFATIAGSVLATYIGFIGPEYAPHFISASVMSAPAAFLIAKVMLPETQETSTGEALKLREIMRQDRGASSVLEAATTGTQDGLKLWLNVVAMLVAFFALIRIVDWPIGAFGEVVFGMGPGELNLSLILGYLFSPVAWFMGVEGWHDCRLMGTLMGLKLVASEYVAFLTLTETVAPEAEVTFESTRSATMAIYALCGFANFASIGIQIGGISALVPERKRDLAELGLKAMIGGAMASWMTATVAGLFV